MVKVVLKQKPGYFGVIRSTRVSRNKRRRLLDEDGEDVDNKLYLLDSNLSREEEIDPQYELFLGRLKKDGKSYILESLEENGKIIIYEGGSSSDTECDQERSRKPSAKKQRDGPSGQMPRVENQICPYSHFTPSTDIERVTRRQTRSQSRRELEENKVSAKNTVSHFAYPRFTHTLKGQSSLNINSNSEHKRILSSKKIKTNLSNQIHDVREDASRSAPMKEAKKSTRKFFGNNPKLEEESEIVQMDLDYAMFMKNPKVKNHYACIDMARTIVYRQASGESIQVKEELSDGSYSDMEILDRTTFYKMNESSMTDQKKSTSSSDFRHEVVTALRKPFDEDELDKLWNDIEIRKPEEGHRDLRNGRERSYRKQKVGKSYLDHYPVLRRKLLEVQDNKPKRLNLLRGFFLWLKHPDSVQPWLDSEFLAINPERS